jgi:hypothetical protein
LSPEEERSVLRSRRRLKFQFYCVQQGLGSEEAPAGVGTLVPDPQKAEFKKIREALAELMSVTDEEDMNQEELATELRKKVRDLEALVVSEPEAAQPAAGEPPAGDVPGGAGAAPAADAPGGGPPAGPAGADLPG